MAVLPFSHLRRCRLPSLPFSSASLLFMLSLLLGGRRGASTGFSSPSLSKVTLRFLASSSRGMVRGVPVPRATGEMLRDCRADTVQASMSMPVADWLAGVGLAGSWVPEVAYSGGGGTALKIAMIAMSASLLSYRYPSYMVSSL